MVFQLSIRPTASLPTPDGSDVKLGGCKKGLKKELSDRIVIVDRCDR
jgi:hypothetical protein